MALTNQGPDRTTSTAGSTRGWVQKVGRWGWAAKGLVYVVLGFLALGVATGGEGGASGEEASRAGAVDTLADQPWGGVLLGVLVVGLVLYGLWRITTALQPGDTDAKAMVKRAAWLGSALVYLALAYLAFQALTSGEEASSGGSSSQEATATLMETGWGRWLVAAAGVAALVGAAYTAREGLQQEFRERIDEASMPSWLRRIDTPLGTAGHLGKAGTMGLIGVFLLKAAWEFDPSEAKGLDTALRETAESGWGTVLVLAIAVGVILYGAYSLLTSPYRELETP